MINIIDWFLYTLLSEKQKEKLANLFSDKQKERIKQITKYGKKHTQKRKVKQIKDHLYTLGFSQTALTQLKDLYETEKDNYMKRLIAWELTLWYANKYTEEDAKQALLFLDGAKCGEKDRHQLRRITIIEAECLERVNDREQAQQILQARLKVEEHWDLYLALANLEQSVERRLHWINKVYEYYDLNPITFSTFENPTYDDLTMKETDKRKAKDEKVTVILPAYNAEEGIQIAVESILAQTWENLELIIVDDCSTDHTLQVIKRYEEHDERVKVFSTPANSGPYIARNIALQHATGTFITVNDADDWSHEKKIEIQVNHLLEHPEIIANTSAHARLTEDLRLYRRGTPGRYIFPNMSSIMFRRKPVMEKLGYWDSVRFAADGEFKRRLTKVFGKESFIDLSSGPLSLPRQSISSLTSSSAFGYNGFFMGVRKEYVESLEYFHEKHDDLYYTYPISERLFPVPEPMWPQREEKQAGKRYFDIVIASDFRKVKSEFAKEIKIIKQIQAKNPAYRIGLVQMYHYDLNVPLEISPYIRKLINGRGLQMLVFGEKIDTENLVLMDYNVIRNEQKYIPTIDPENVTIVVQDYGFEGTFHMDQVQARVKQLVGKQGTLYPVNESIRKKLIKELDGQESNFITDEAWVFSDEK